MPQSKFWEEVEQAYTKVAANHELEVTVAREGKEASIYWTDNYGTTVICIEIEEVPTETKEPLISP